METPTYITEKKVAVIMDCATQTLRNKRFRGEGPPYIKLDRAVRYSLQDVLSYMEKHKVIPKGQKMKIEVVSPRLVDPKESGLHGGS